MPSDPKWFREMAEHWRELARIGDPIHREARLRLAAHYDDWAIESEDAGNDEPMP